MLNTLITILGPTASGKTKLACQLAYEIKGEIISADSRQIYRKMDIGTGKDLDEYVINGKKIPYHLIDIRDAGYKYNIWEYQQDFLNAFNTILKRKKQPILCGGSGLYIETALNGNIFLGIPPNETLRTELNQLDLAELKQKWEKLPDDLKSKLDQSTKKRIIRGLEIDAYLKEHPTWKPPTYPAFKSIIIGVNIERGLRRQKITQRLSHRLNNGMYDEVKSLLADGLTYEDLSYYGLEYKWIGNYLQGKISKKEMFDGLNVSIHQFAKRQMTWFRRMEKQGHHIHWIDASMPLLDMIERVKTLIQGSIH
ncbi:MAG TPA: tRNA (adenosine(37)-N6)-dimethylallyltransferase MiaA [Crocinitomix sp.]|nr:tRNA (adenosine(37)-N6)-dimethylallyltransferase MiaA [Crocinitomix sp.]